jgi:pimeloyl-ACP methyl ester carboxylesterase
MRIRTGDRETVYDDVGDGPPLVLLHAFPLEGRRGRDEAIALVEARGVDAFLDTLLPRLFSAHATDALRDSTRALCGQRFDAVVAALTALRDRPDRRPELPSIACPTLVIVGTEDTLTPPAEAAAMARAIPNARLAELPGAGHLANLEAPSAFAAAIA